MRKIKNSAEAKWKERRERPGSLRELNNELSKLRQISHELQAYPQIVPEQSIQGIKKLITDSIESEGDKAQECMLDTSSRALGGSAVAERFRTHLIALGRISHHLCDFKVPADAQISRALAHCHAQKWGARFLLQLGMRLSDGTGGEAGADDDVVSKQMVNSFWQLSHARTVMFNKETKRTHRDIEKHTSAPRVMIQAFFYRLIIDLLD